MTDLLRDHRAAIRLSRQTLERLLMLPAGMVVVGIQSSVDPVSFRIVVQSRQLPAVDPVVEAPPLDGGWGYEVYTAPDGVPYYRWRFQPTKEEGAVDAETGR